MRKCGNEYGQMTKLAACVCFMNWVLYKMFPVDLVTRTAANGWFLCLAVTLSVIHCVNVYKNDYM